MAVRNQETQNDPEASRPETPESKTLKEIEKRKDGSMLNAFGKMMDTFISESKLSPDKLKWAEELKWGMIRQASGVLNDDTLNAEWKSAALQKLFGTFKENKEFFPTPAEISTQAQDTAKAEWEKKQNFYEKLMKSLDQVDAERSGRQIAQAGSIRQNPEWMAGKDWPPATLATNKQADADLSLV